MMNALYPAWRSLSFEAGVFPLGSRRSQTHCSPRVGEPGAQGLESLLWEPQPPVSRTPRGKGEECGEEERERLLPWLAGHRAGRAEGSGGARAGRASVGTASLRRAPRALRTPPLALVLPPRLPSPLPPRPPRPGSNILRGLEHARLENNTTFQKPFQEQRVPEGKEAGLLLLF